MTWQGQQNPPTTLHPLLLSLHLLHSISSSPPLHPLLSGDLHLLLSSSPPLHPHHASTPATTARHGRGGPDLAEKGGGGGSDGAASSRVVLLLRRRRRGTGEAARIWQRRAEEADPAARLRPSVTTTPTARTTRAHVGNHGQPSDDDYGQPDDG